MEYEYQVYLLPYACRISGGELTLRDDEVLESRWFDLDEAAALGDQLPKNAELVRSCLPRLKELAKTVV